MRRKYFDEFGEEHIEEIEVPEGEIPSYVREEQQPLEEGAVIIHSPDETDTATEEELVCFIFFY